MTVTDEITTLTPMYLQLELSLVQCFSPYPSTVRKLGIKIARIKTDRGAEVFEQEVWSQYEE
jgi:hypothetical protein